MQTSYAIEFNEKSNAGISIIGDQEMPKILYIISWKEAKLPVIVIPEVNYKNSISYNPCQFISSSLNKNLSKKSKLSCILNTLPLVDH